MNCICGCSASTQNVRNVLLEIVQVYVRTRACCFSDAARSAQPSQQTSDIDPTSCVFQTRNHGGKLKARPLDSHYGQCNISEASFGRSVKTELDFKQSGNKYYSVPSKALSGAYVILQTSNRSLSAVAKALQGFCVIPLFAHNQHCV